MDAVALFFVNLAVGTLLGWDLPCRNNDPSFPLSKSADEVVSVGIARGVGVASLVDIHLDKMHPTVASASDIGHPLWLRRLWPDVLAIAR